MEVKFFDSLFEGDSAVGVKFCMGLTGGDFWAMVAGCQNLYRGPSIEMVDFDTVLGVMDTDEDFIELATIQHITNSRYVYVLRRVNGCGDEEESVNAAVKVVFDEDGDLIGPSCNCVLAVKAFQVAGPKVKLLWYFSPIGQRAQCSSFNIYGDNGTGQVDYGNAIAILKYAGAKFYSYESEILNQGRYMFCVKPLSTDGLEDVNSKVTEIEVDESVPIGVDILRTKVI